MDQEVPRSTRGIGTIQSLRSARIGSRWGWAMSFHLQRAVALIVTTLATAGCYPIYKTLQEKARVRVVDERGEALAGAEVHLITSSYPYGGERDRETKTTDAEGVATFVKKTEWRIEHLMLHGAEIFFWNWCVRHEGRRTVATTYQSADDFKTELEIMLQYGRPSDCGDPNEPRWLSVEPAFGGHPPGAKVSCSFLRAATAEQPEPEYETQSDCASFNAAAYPRIDSDVLARADYQDGLAEMWIDGAWYYVRPTGESLRVVTSDNGPDPWSEGLVRVDRIERIAYADRDFQEVIEPRFSWAWPFRDGVAIACGGCRLSDPDEDGHRMVTGGRWGAINRSGDAVVPFMHTSHAEVVQALSELR